MFSFFILMFIYLYFVVGTLSLKEPIVSHKDTEPTRAGEAAGPARKRHSPIPKPKPKRERDREG